MGLGDAIKLCIRRYATFRGRSLRSEFWWWTAFGLFVEYALGGLLRMAGGDWIAAGLSWALLLPTLAVTARRLHDVGRSGWWQVGMFAPGVLLMLAVLAIPHPVLALAGTILLLGGLVLLIFWLVDPGEPGPNAYGPPPMPPAHLPPA